MNAAPQKWLWRSLLALMVLPVFYVYRVPFLDVDPVRLLETVAAIALGLMIATGRLRLDPRHAGVFLLLLAVAAVSLIDLLRMEDQPGLVRNIGNHLASLTIVALVVVGCDAPRKLDRLIAFAIWGSAAALFLSAWWLAFGSLPLNFLVRGLVGADISLADVSFAIGNRFRLAAAFYDPNFYGMYLVLVVALTLNRLAFVRRQWSLYVLLGANVLAVLLTMSRTSLVGLMVVLLVTAVGAPVLRRGTVVLVIVLGVLLPLAAAIGVVPSPLVVIERFAEVQDRAGRLMYHEAGLEAFRESPIVGVGSDGLLAWVQRYRAVDRSSAHMVYLTWLARHGILGTIVYVTFLCLPPLWVLKQRGISRQYRHLVLSTYLPLMVMYGAYDYFETLPMQYIIFGFGYAVVVHRFGCSLQPATPATTSRPGTEHGPQLDTPD